MAVTGINITLTTRTAKGSALTHAELDANQTGLKEAVEGHSHDEFAAKLGTDDNYMTDAEKAKLAGIEAGAEANVQADWNASTGDAAILNKPSIPSISGLLNEAAHDALDHSGLPGVPASYTLPVASTTVLGGVKVDGTTVLISDGVISSTGGSGGGVTDHGLLTGLGDDDHTQYLNTTRGDARYSQTGHSHSLNNLTEKSYNSLTDKPSIPSIAGLLNETAHDSLDHIGLIGVLGIGTTGTTACAGNDSRLSDSRTPTTHSHAQSDVTDLTTAIAAKQATLVSGTNIKTINGASVLGSGDIATIGITNPMTAAGDLIIGGTDGAPTRLAKGADGQVCTLVSGVPAWAAASGDGSGNLRVADVLTSETISSWATAGLSNIAYKFSAQIITAAVGSILMQINSGNPAGSEIHLSGNSTIWGGGSGTSIAEVAYSFEAGDNIGIEGTVYPDGSSVKVDVKTTIKRTNATLIIYWYHLSFANTAIDKLELELTNGIAAGSTITIDKVRA